MKTVPQIRVAAAPATLPVTKHPWRRKPPVGASQSIISPAQYTPGICLSMRLASSYRQATPPDVEIASSIGRACVSGMRQHLTTLAKASAESNSPWNCRMIAQAVSFSFQRSPASLKKSRRADSIFAMSISSVKVGLKSISIAGDSMFLSCEDRKSVV